MNMMVVIVNEGTGIDLGLDHSLGTGKANVQVALTWPLLVPQLSQLQCQVHEARKFIFQIVFQEAFNTLVCAVFEFVKLISLVASGQ